MTASIIQLSGQLPFPIFTAFSIPPFPSSTMGVYQTIDEGKTFTAPPGVTNPTFTFTGGGSGTVSGDTQVASLWKFNAKWWVAYEFNDFGNGPIFAIANATNLGGPYTWVADINIFPGFTGTAWNPRWFQDDGVARPKILVQGQQSGEDTAMQPFIVEFTDDTLSVASLVTQIGQTGLPSNVIDCFICMPSQSPNGLYNVWFKNEADKLIGYMSSSSLKTGYTVTVPSASNILNLPPSESCVVLKKRGGGWRFFGTLNGDNHQFWLDSTDWTSWGGRTDCIEPIGGLFGTFISGP